MQIVQFYRFNLLRIPLVYLHSHCAIHLKTEKNRMRHSCPDVKYEMST